METETTPAVASLVNGIVQDAHDLVKEEIKLLKVEAKNHLQQTGQAAVPFLLGLLLSQSGLMVLALAGGLLLSWFFPTLPVWGGFALIGAPLLVVGAVLALWGKCQIEACYSEPGARRRSH